MIELKYIGKQKQLTPDEKVKVFDEQIDKLQPACADGAIKEITKECISIAPDYFFVSPASTSNHHPIDERSEGGNILHTKRVFSVCEMIMETDMPDINSPIWSYISDKLYVLSAALLHDTLQYGIPPITELKTDQYHPFYPYFYYISLIKINRKSPSGSRKANIMDGILKIVSLHMGRWTPPNPFEYTDKQKSLGDILHKADYIASRENVTVRI